VVVMVVGTVGLVALTELSEVVLSNGTPTLSDEVFFESLVVVTSLSESVPFVVSVETFLLVKAESGEVFNNVNVGFTDDAGRANSSGDLFINNDGLDHFLSDSLSGDYWFDELDGLLKVDGFGDSDLLGYRDVVSDFDLLGESLLFEGLDFLLSSDVFNDFNLLHDGDVFDDLNGLGDKSGFDDFDFLDDNLGFVDFDSLGDGDSLSVLDVLQDLSGFQDFNSFLVSSSFNNIDFLQEGSGFDDLLLFSEEVSVLRGKNSLFDNFLLDNDGLFNNDFLLDKTSLLLVDTGLSHSGVGDFE